MSINLLRRLGLALAGAGVAFAMAACGGGGDDSGGGNGSVRLLNVTNDIASLDLYSEKSDTQTLRNEAIARDGLGEYATLAKGTYSFQVKRAGNEATLLEQTSRSIAGDGKYTMVAYSYEGAYKSVLLSENDDTKPDAGKTRLRVLNLSSDAGNVDIYVTDANTPLSDASAIILALEGGSVSAFTSVNSGDRRIRVTGAGNKDDVRLDIPVAALGDTTTVNLLLTPTNGGVLVHGYLLPQGGDLTVAKNSQARVRLIASVSTGGSVGATVNGAVLGTALRSPQVAGTYTNVPAGALAGSFTVNGAAVTAPTATLVAGNDYSLMVAGVPGASTVYVLPDDNRAPTTTGRSKVRLVNGVAGDVSGLSMTIDFESVADGTLLGTASTPKQVPFGTEKAVQVTSPLSANPLYDPDNGVTLIEGAVYSVFVLSGNVVNSVETPQGIMRRDR